MPKYLSLAELCAALHLSRSRVYQLLAANKFPKPLKLSEGKTGRILWPADQIEKWLSERSRATYTAPKQAA